MDSTINQQNEPLLHDILTIKKEFISNKNNQKNVLDENQQEIIENLVFMGFNLEMIDMCFCFFTINNIEQAIQFMSKENEIWQHDYIKSESNLCIICNEFSNHKNLIIDKEKKLEKLKKLNDSFNSKFRSSIEYLRESNANRRSNISNNSDLLSIKENKNSDIFEININFGNDINKNNAIIKIKNKSNNPDKAKGDLLNKNRDSHNLDSFSNNYDDSFSDSMSIDEKAFIKLLNNGKGKSIHFDIKDKIEVLDIGETQIRISRIEKNNIDNSELNTGN